MGKPFWIKTIDVDYYYDDDYDDDDDDDYYYLKKHIAQVVIAE